MSRSRYQHPPAQTDGRNHDRLAALRFLEREARWHFPAPDFSAPLSGRYRRPKTSRGHEAAMHAGGSR